MKTSCKTLRASVPAIAVASLFALAGSADAADSDLAKQLSNPIASLISVPFQFNYDTGYGPADGHKAYLNVQPVIPFSLNDDWNVISRTIVPIAWQSDIAGSSGNQFGLGDIVQSVFFSPKKPTAGGIIWGVGPVFLVPTATDELLGGKKWGAGPTAVILKQSGPWTFGMLANHIWSFAGASDRADVNATFLQPFVAYTTPDAWTFTLNSESTYNWAAHEWSIPINASVSKLVKFGAQPVSLTAGVRYWVDSPAGGPEGFGIRLGATLLFPKG
ncbi:transporter [Mesorhizobium sp. B2-4-14]|uniref:transporter n=1 Tax=Mesorhizobium sp. B2-4-14 TaxID=2589935 RepID=UPI00112EF4E8|nr:transporter [Mesorhizobium sp. B2-4-14]TPL02627.1 transporter [Mesorhizobium sp. B2-4-14]